MASVNVIQNIQVRISDFTYDNVVPVASVALQQRAYERKR